MGYDSKYYFSVLKKALEENEIFQSNVSFGGFDDDSICIEKEASRWIVYSVDRGNKLRRKEYDSIETACYDVIHRATSGASEEAKTKRYFDKLIKQPEQVTDRLIRDVWGNPYMNKSKLIAAIAERTFMTWEKSEVAVNGILDVISTSMAQGEKVQITGFGTFDVKSRPARVARNPRTGASVKVAASKAPAFKAGKALKDIVGVAAKTPRVKTTKAAKKNAAKAPDKKKNR